MNLCLIPVLLAVTAGEPGKFDAEVAAMQTKFKVDEKDKEILLLAKDKELQLQKMQWLLVNRNRMKHRAKELGAVLEIVSAAGTGSTIQLVMVV